MRVAEGPHRPVVGDGGEAGVAHGSSIAAVLRTVPNGHGGGAPVAPVTLARTAAPGLQRAEAPASRSERPGGER